MDTIKQEYYEDDVKEEPKVIEETSLETEVKYENLKEELNEKILVHSKNKRSHGIGFIDPSNKKIKLESHDDEVAVSIKASDVKVSELEQALEAERKISEDLQSQNAKYKKDVDKWKCMYKEVYETLIQVRQLAADL